jgi:hypothetical protein
MVNKRDAEVFIVCLSYHIDVGLFHVIGHGDTPLVVLDCRWISYRKNTGYHATDPKIRTQGAERGDLGSQ